MLSIDTAQKRAVPTQRRTSGNLGRIAKYTFVRGSTILITVVIGVYLAILIANMGGYVDEMRIGQLKEQIAWK